VLVESVAPHSTPSPGSSLNGATVGCCALRPGSGRTVVERDPGVVREPPPRQTQAGSVDCPFDVGTVGVYSIDIRMGEDYFRGVRMPRPSKGGAYEYARGGGDCGVRRATDAAVLSWAVDVRVVRGGGASRDRGCGLAQGGHRRSDHRRRQRLAGSDGRVHWHSTHVRRSRQA
jgi:hypothetical protein